ncbi:SusC/RagA family TonB-linked outer membrane protein [Paraflavitalea soli]|uniref:SusC/RagA family TonB-linked outer membrane protein n=1 Tax=Paraflavitalea soli TaxID=2315862 RepID=A0A3B7MUR6_9BACT|nr:SusC/RagA family TonB-linked outer membrane protein [Paraflavitalea soli]AXY75375.1 SusC/RagA family TonB-linked outer membrane protein [Paraflavitalea soli]
MQTLVKPRPGMIALVLAALFLAPLTMLAQTDRQVSGTVTDASTNLPLQGVSVTLAGKTTGTSTNDKGHFTLEAAVNSKLSFSFTGYVTQTVTVPATGDLSLRLEVTNQSLNEVVVIGYGQARKKDLTGAITQIRPDKIADQNPNTVQDIVRGTPGLSVGLDPNGKGGGSIQIRGQRSVYTDAGHNDPLLVLDGMIFYGELSEINPDDIAQIDVLKDASAAAVYGAKSANGVLIITTKRGQKGKPRINFTSNLGISTKAGNRDVFGPEGYIQYREDWYKAATFGVNAATGQYEAYQVPLSGWGTNKRPGYFENPTPENLAKYGITIDQWRAYSTNLPTDNDVSIYGKRLAMSDVTLNNYVAGKTYNWQDHSFRTGINQDYNLSASGASDNMNYYMSLGYLSNQGPIRGDDYKAIRANMKVEGKIAKWLEVGGNINFQNRTDGNLAVDWQKQSLRNSPFANYYLPDGRLAWHPQGDGSTNNLGYNYDFDRQYMDLDKGYTVFNAILNAKVKLPFNITYSFNASPRYQTFRDRYFESARHPDWTANNGLVNREQTQRFDWSLNNTINWEHTFAKKHRVAVTLVQEAENRQSWKDRIEARNILPSDALGLHETQNGDKARSTFDSEDTKETADGMLARLFYSFDDRYMLTASFRRDGYSAFGNSNPRANFFSIAGAWTFSNESFFKWEPMSTGKLRASWGQNGNRSLADPYTAVANLTVGGGGTMGYLDNGGNLKEFLYLFMNRLANNNLTWEKTESFNVGLDFGFLNDRITGSIDYYITPTVAMIMNRTLPDFTGFSSITTNLGKVDNRGFELSINTVNIKNRDFSWNTTFGFSKYKNTIKHLYYEYQDILDGQGNVISTRERDVIPNNWFIGQPISTIWNYRVTGIWQKNEVAEAAIYNQRPGDPKVANNYTADDKVNATNPALSSYYNDNDKEFLGQTAPPIMWSMRNDFTYKNFNFSFNMYSYWGHKSLVGIYLNQDNGTSLVTNQANQWKKEYWTLDNPTNSYARLDARGPVGTGSNAPGKLYDRSFIRLENVTVGYTLDKKLLSKVGVEKIKVFASVRNVALWTKEKDWHYGDMETFNTSGDAGQIFRSGMAPRIFTFGLNATF